MADLKIAILGLGRMGSSVGLALKRYMRNKGKHSFEITGYDSRSNVEKAAVSLKAVDRTENRVYSAVQGKDIVVMALPYDEVKIAYETIANDLRDGVVILDMSPVKQPSIEWGKEYLTDEHHIVGMTPIVNSAHLFDGVERTEDAAEDMFDGGAIMLSPAASSIKEAVDLAFNFAAIIGGKPTFMDPAEHDVLMSFTEGLPALLGVAAFYTGMKHQGWGDIRRLINPSFGVLTHHLYDTHPDDLRDQLFSNREPLVRYLDALITSLKGLHDVMASNDKDALEAVLVESAATYEKWINQRRSLDWDDLAKNTPDAQSGIMGGLLGGALSGKLFGSKDKDDEK